MQDKKITEVAAKYSVAITPQLAEMLDDPGISKQFVPSIQELEYNQQDLSDPIGDALHSPCKGIIHRYPDRCLLQPVKVCAVYCRFCFRRETVGKAKAGLSQQELHICYEYIRNHPQIWEVILSGGDPLILSPMKLSAIISELDQIPHVEIIRIHTRVPLVDSARINPAMLTALSQRRPVYIALHINHPSEFSPAAIKAINDLADRGLVLLGQTVLLKGVNDQAEILGRLFRTMVKNRIKPYYLHHPDRAPGTAHFRTTIAAGQALMAQLRGNYSGLCQPEYVLDIPHGAGKSPIGPCYIHRTGDQYVVTNYQGKQFTYSDPDPD